MAPDEVYHYLSPSLLGACLKATIVKSSHQAKPNGWNQTAIIIKLYDFTRTSRRARDGNSNRIVGGLDCIIKSIDGLY